MNAAGNDERSFAAITRGCMDYYSSQKQMTPCELAAAIMADKDIPMHNFAHHYLVPAVLMSMAGRKQGVELEEYAKKMAEIAKRAKNVLPAFCGFYGACGAAVGIGIFMSVWTDTTPLTKATWGMCNMATSVALKKMAEVGGPRCCKRNTFLALECGAAILAERLGIELGPDAKIACSFSQYNNECLKEDCPFYKKK